VTVRWTVNPHLLLSGDLSGSLLGRLLVLFVRAVLATTARSFARPWPIAFEPDGPRCYTVAISEKGFA
jgi:hypothetical protein